MKKLMKSSIVPLILLSFVAGCGKKPSYTVTWVIDGEETKESYLEGETPSYKNGTPKKENDKTYSYSFKGWDKDITPISGDITYTAVFDNTYIDYTVTWSVNGNDSSEIYHYGDMPTYKGDTAKESDHSYTYEFKGFDKEIVPVSEDVTYTAVYDSKAIEYVITWVIDGKETKENYHYGDTPSYKGETDKKTDETYSYTFKGFDKEIVPVTENTTYTALYDSTYVEYVISWDVDGKITTENYHYGETPSFKGALEKEGNRQYSYTFEKWDKEITPVKENTTYKAVFTQSINKYQITFVIGDKKVTEDVEYGTMPTPPSDTAMESTAESDYTFIGWDKEIVEVTGDATYVAKYSTSKRKYKVTFKMGDTILGVEDVEYGSTPALKDIADPNKDGLTFYGYEIDGTTYTKDNLPIITEEKTATAVFKAAVKLNYCDALTEAKMSEKTYYYDVNEIYNIESEAKENYVSDKDYVKGIADQNKEETIYCSSLSTWDKSEEAMKVIDENHYEIHTASQFASFSASVNAGTTYEGKTITLKTSVMIDKDFKRIGSSSATSFKGVFDGSHCSIRGIDMDSTATRTALFYELTGGTIKNLSTYGKVNAGQYGSVLVGRNMGGTIDNVTNYASLNQQAKLNGGGALSGGINNGATIINSTNYGAITGTATNNKTAGIVGMVESTGVNRVENTRNFGTVKGQTLVGGIAGEVAASKSVIKGCENYGTIESLATAANAGVIGGIVGQMTKSTKVVSTAAITDSTNYGAINGAKNSDVAVGGVVGAYNITTTMSNVKNYGNISGNSRTGGIAGHLYGKLENAKNYGSVVTGFKGSTSAAAGNYASGIAAVVYHGSEITKADNYGSVTGLKLYAGGIVGALSSATTVKVNDCNNHGKINGKNGVGGIAGGTISTNSTLNMTNCMNDGEIKGNNKVGGLVGCLWSDTSSIVNSVSTGTVTATATSGTIYSSDTIGQNLEQYNEEKAN